MNSDRPWAVVLVVSLTLLGACSGATPAAEVRPNTAPAQPAPLSRTSDGGGVTIVAGWAGPDAGAVFTLALDTHSVDLDGLDLADAVLRNDLGLTLSARPWEAPNGGHHRAGRLAFDGDAVAFFAGATWIELVLKGVGDLPERTLRWEVWP